MGLWREFERAARSISRNDTEAVVQVKREQFAKSLRGRAVSFRQLCLVDVEDDSLGFGGNGCQYTGHFVLASTTLFCPVIQPGERGADVVSGYNPPHVVKRHICKQQALAYVKYHLYPVAGRISTFQFGPILFGVDFSRPIFSNIMDLELD